MSKRGATTNLNRDNWDQEAEPEESGTFKRASDSELQTRVIRKGKRRGQGESYAAVFNNLTAFATNTTDSTPKFNFLGNSTPKFSFGNTDSSSTNSIHSNSNPSLNMNPLLQSNSIPNPLFNSDKTLNPILDTNKSAALDSSKDKSSYESVVTPSLFSFGSKSSDLKQSSSSVQTSDPSKLTNGKPSKSNHSLYCSNLKSLNKSVLKWAQKHFDENPYINMTPIFDDYKKHIEDLKTKYPANKKNEGESFPLKSEEANKKTNEDTTQIKNDFSFGSQKSSSTFSFGSQNAKKDFNFLASESNKTFSFGSQNDNKGFSFGTSESKSFSFGDGASSNSQETHKEAEGDPSDEVPNVQVNEVKEEDAIYEKKVKLFYKKDETFIDKGVGTLFLKPAGEKTQLIIRAMTNLGNILLNIILNESIPTQRVGKNNVLIICIPNPPVDPKSNDTSPVSMLIRVKSAQDADELLAKIDENKN